MQSSRKNQNVEVNSSASNSDVAIEIEQGEKLPLKHEVKKTTTSSILLALKKESEENKAIAIKLFITTLGTGIGGVCGMAISGNHLGIGLGSMMGTVITGAAQELVKCAFPKDDVSVKPPQENTTLIRAARYI